MEENQEKIVEIALDRLNQEGLWFTTKDDKMYANATNLFKLDKFGELEEKSVKRLLEEITDSIGDGAGSIIEAVDQWIEDNLVLGTIGYVDTLAMNFEIPEVSEEVTAYSEEGVKDLGAEESEEADQLKDHAEEPKKEDKKKKTESKKIVEDSEEDDSICIDDWYFDNEDLGNVVKLKTTNEKKLNEITEKISEQTIEDSYIDPMSIKSNTEFSFFVHQAYPKQICKFVEEAIRCGLFITKDVNKAFEALDSALKEAVADRIEAHAIWKKNIEDELEKIRNGEPVEDKSVKQRADNLIMKDLDVEELQKIYTYVKGWKSCNDIDVDGVFGNSSGQFMDDELESDGSKEYLKWIKDMYLEAIQEAIDVAKENEEQFEESKKITEAYTYYWKDDIDEVDAESEANDELFYAVAEHMQETDDYYSSWDVYDIMSDIICLWKIEKRSRLYDYLIKWYGSEEEMLKHVRDVYETNNAIYFVTGIGYSIFSADLLGGTANGQAERDFDTFVNNGGKKEESKKVTEAKDINNLKSELENKVRKVMTSVEFGFDESDVNDYFVVEVTDAGSNGVKAEVRAEVSYDGLMELADALNPIVAKYDKEAYFDAETAGILVAYITTNSSKLNESVSKSNLKPDGVWIIGTVEVDGVEYKVNAKVYLEGSEFGINDGPVSKLYIAKDGKCIINYDRSWDIKPTKEYKSVYEEILKQVTEFRANNPYEVTESLEKRLAEAFKKPLTEGNTIPRNWSKITYKSKTDTNAGKAGTVFEVTKDDFDTITTNTETGESFQVNWNLVRNPELAEIINVEKKVTEGEEVSPYKQKFIDYCEGKVKDLGYMNIAEDDEINSYKILMTDSTYSQANGKAYILSDLDNTWEELIVADENGNIFIHSPMSIPVFEAAEMTFDEIDPEIYNELITYWDDHDLDDFCERDANKNN